MSDSLDSAIERIKNKANLRAWVETLDDDTEGIILTRRKDEQGNEVHTRKYIGDIRVDGANWLCDSYKSFLQRATDLVDGY